MAETLTGQFVRCVLSVALPHSTMGHLRIPIDNLALCKEGIFDCLKFSHKLPFT